MAVEIALKEIAGTNSPLFVYISDILGLPVLDDSGSVMGKLVDLKVKLGEAFPRVTAVAVKRRKKKKLQEIEWTEVNDCHRGGIVLQPGAAAKFRPLEVAQDEILLRDELLDKQVVDTSGARIERVNDIHLLSVHRDLRLVHVDFGARGLLRRLGWLAAVDKLTRWLFAYEVGDKMISWKFVQPLLSNPDKKNLKLNVTARKIHELHPSDLADIIEEVDAVNRSSIFRTLDLQTAALTLEEVEDPKLQASLIDSTTAELVTDILEEMAPDEATDLLADLPEEQMHRLMRTMDPPSRRAVEELLRFKEGTAGSIMTKDFFSVPREWTVEQAVEEFRRTTYPLESVAYLYIKDKDGKLTGVCTLRHLIIADKAASLGSLMNPHIISVEAEDKVDEVTALFRKYKFLSLPVVDRDGIQQGLITLKDILREEFEE